MIKITLLTLLFFCPVTHADNERVSLYDIYKSTITDNSDYNNRFDYSEVAYTATFQATNSKAYQISGFYNGLNDKNDHIWEFRFMLNKPGLWVYHIENNQGINIKSGNFEVTEKPTLINNHGHVKVDEKNPKYLIHEDGTPHYWIGGKWISARDYGPESKSGEVNKSLDPRVKVLHGHKSDQQLIDYLDLLEQYKHNGLLLKIAQYPLENDRLSWDLSWIKRGEWLVKEALKRGIYVQVNMFDTWSRNKNKYFENKMPGGDQLFDVWNDGDDNFKQNYLRYIISRFAAFPNVYWELGNEMDHPPNCGDCFVKLANKKYIPWIKMFDPYNLPIGLSESVWKTANVEIGFLHQSNELPDSSLKRPVIMNELVRYDFEQSFVEKVIRKLFKSKLPGGLWHNNAMKNKSLRYIYRRTFWKVFTHGGSGSSEATWLNIEEKLSENVLLVMSDHMHLSNVIQKFLPELNTMNPIKDFIVSIEEDEQISTRGNRNVLISYFDAGQEESLEAGTISIPGIDRNYQATWLDPSTGTTISQFKLSGSDKQLERPAYLQDIVLILQPLN